MNDNYLWDRTGEPDPQLQELEETLASLRYQSRPLPIPANLIIARQWRFNSMAIAAAVALLVIAGGVMRKMSRRQIANTPPSVREAVNGPQVAPASLPARSPTILPEVRRSVPRERPQRSLLAANRRRSRKSEPDVPVLTAQELAEKEQVLLALRMVSAKLNFAQRKVQGLPVVNTIRNQHKIG